MEITCPECQYSRNIPDDKVPATSVKATCPMCGTKFRFRELDPALKEELERRVEASDQTDDAATPDSAMEAAPNDAQPAPAEARQTEEQPPAPAAEDARQTEQEQPVEPPRLDPPPAAPRDDERMAHPGEHRPDDIWQKLDDMGDRHPGRPNAQDGDQPPYGEGEAVVDVPFERLDQFGFFGGIIETCRRTLVAPRLFFETMPIDRGYGRPVIFYVLLNILGVMLQLAFEFAMHGVPTPNAADLPAGAAELSAGAGIVGAFLFVVVAGPAMLTLFLYGISGVLHLFLTLMQGVSGGFQATVRAVSYSALPALCMAIPQVGMYIGSVWSIVMLTYALRGVHKTSYLKAGLTVMLYTLAGVGLIMAAAGGMPLPGAGL